MKKIPSVFERDWNGNPSHVLDKVTPGCEWVLAGEGVITRKRDGTAILVRGSSLFFRYEVKHGKAPPAGFEPCQDPDPITGDCPGWIPAIPSHGFYKFLIEARNRLIATLADGTYELCGPKVNANPENLAGHVLFRHGGERFSDWGPRAFSDIKAYLGQTPWEGIVWHHLDGRMAKAKRRDFGLPWPVEPVGLPL